MEKYLNKSDSGTGTVSITVGDIFDSILTIAFKNFISKLIYLIIYLNNYLIN